MYKKSPGKKNALLKNVKKKPRLQSQKCSIIA
jgi:hypothetical protein